MIELYLSKVTENSETEKAGNYYARVSYKQTMGVQDMAHHMAEHNTMFSEGSISSMMPMPTRWLLPLSVHCRRVPRPVLP